jgi:hypothetical protein
VQRVEVGIAREPEHHGLAVQHEVCLPDLARDLDDPGVAVGPVVAAAGDQAHAIAIALQAEAAVVHVRGGHFRTHALRKVVGTIEPLASASRDT